MTQSSKTKKTSRKGTRKNPKNGKEKTVKILDSHLSDFARNIKISESVINPHLDNLRDMIEHIVSEISTGSKMYNKGILSKGLGKGLFSKDVLMVEDRILDWEISLLLNEYDNRKKSQMKFYYTPSKLENEDTKEIRDLVDIKLSGLISPNVIINGEKLGEDKAIENVALNLVLIGLTAFLHKTFIPNESEDESIFMDTKGNYKIIVSEFMKRLGATPFREVGDIYKNVDDDDPDSHMPKHGAIIQHPITREYLNYERKSMSSLLYYTNQNNVMETCKNALVNATLPNPNNFTITKFIDLINEREDWKNSIISLCKWSNKNDKYIPNEMDLLEDKSKESKGSKDSKDSKGSKDNGVFAPPSSDGYYINIVVNHVNPNYDGKSVFMKFQSKAKYIALMELLNNNGVDIGKRAYVELYEHNTSDVEDIVDAE